MLRKIWLLSLFCLCGALLFGCAEENETDGAFSEKAPSSADDVILFESDFGYTMEYDPKVFYVLTDDNSDTFGLWSEASDAELSASINVGRVSGYTLKEYSEEITNAVESGVWSVTEAEFGAGGYNSTTVLYEETTDYGEAHYAVVLIRDGSGIIVLETVTHAGVDAATEDLIRDTLATFKIN